MEREVLMKSAGQVGEVVQGMAEGSRKRMGREYASAYEAWAVLADGLERAKSDMKALEKLHTDSGRPHARATRTRCSSSCGRPVRARRCSARSSRPLLPRHSGPRRSFDG